MDYDQTNMPENYERGRSPPPGVLDMWTVRIGRSLEGHRFERIVDLGCGTGRFAARLADLFGAHVVGVDPSEKMLAVAREKPSRRDVEFVKGAAERIPCRDGSVGLIFMSMAFHHFLSPESAMREFHRVLRPGGLVCVRNSTRDRGSPYEAYFPNYRDSLDRLPAISEIRAAFVDGGFEQLHHEVVDHLMAHNLDELAEKASHRADSTLLRLSDRDFEAGLSAMRGAASPDSRPVTLGIDLFLFARAPGARGT